MIARRGQALVTLVLISAAVVGVAVSAGHWLERSSQRTLFTLQESRELANLGRSALAEAHHQLHGELARRTARWVDWCLTRGTAQPRPLAVPAAHDVATALSTPNYLTYTTSDVRVRRVRSLADGHGLGELELTVHVSVTRAAHHAELDLVERRGFWLAMPFAGGRAGGRLVELTASPLATLIEGAP